VGRVSVGRRNRRFSAGDPPLKVGQAVVDTVKGMQTNRFEIRPGQANQLKMMNRLAPGFILKQMSRSVDRMLRTQN
jgi:uncharacterized oxidoreductase